MRFSTSLLCAALAWTASADITFTTPAAGATVSGLTIDMAWENSGTGTAISALSTYQIFLMVGGNTDGEYEVLTTLVSSGDFSTGNSASATIVSTIGGDVDLAYFLKIVAVKTAGGTITNYSSRFSLASLTGTMSTAIQQFVEALDGTTAGPTNDDTETSTATTAYANSYDVPYSLQTGLTRYAPMQGVPPTKITATSTEALFPTSAFTIATTYMSAATIATTLTESLTFSVSSNTNTAAAASFPTGGVAASVAKRWADE